MTMLTTEQLNAIKERAEKVVNNDWFSDEGEFLLWESLDDITAKDIPALLQSIDELKKALLDTTDESDIFRENLKTIERLTECETTRDFATRALKGEATLRIGGDAND